MAKAKTSTMDAIAREAGAMEAEEENIYEVICNDGRQQPNLDEAMVLTIRFHRTDNEIKSNLRRVRAKLHNMQAAGSPEDLAKALEYAAATAAKAKSEGAELQRQADELLSQKNKLERESEQAARRVEEMQAARKVLPDLQPKSVRTRMALRRSAVKQTLGVRVHELEGRKSEIEALLSKPAQSDKNAMHWVDAWRRYCPQSFVQNGNQGWEPTARHSELCDELKSELKTINNALPEAKAKFEAALAELESAE